MKLPTAKEINPYDDLDGRTADLHLEGKTVEDAVALLKENSLYYQEDYLWMGPVAFCYYFAALLVYLDCNESKDDDLLLYFMIGTFRSRVEHDGKEILSTFPAMREFYSKVSSDFVRYNFDDKYQARFHRRIAELESAMELVESAAPT